MGSDWQDVTLSDLIDIKHGYAFPGEFIKDSPAGDILLTPGNFAIGGGFKAGKFKYFDGTVPVDYVLEEGDLIVTMTDLSKQADTLGYPALVPRANQRRFLHNQRLGKIIIRDGAQVDKRFLSYLLRTPEYRHEVLASATGTTVKHTSPSRILKFKTSIPPTIHEQHAIAHILGTLDDKIELNRRMNETLEAMAQTLFKSWFVDFEPVRAKAEGRTTGLTKEIADLFPDSFGDSDLGEVPKGWRVGCVDDEFNLTMGQSPPGETYNEAQAGLPFFQGRTDFGFRYPSQRVFCTAPTRLADAGDTLISVRAPVGDINMATERCCIGRGVAAARHRSGSKSYTYYFMQATEEIFNRFEAEGTVFGAIGKKDFHAIPCIVPPREVIEEYERLMAPVDGRIESNEQEFRTLTAQRDTLLPKLVSGELPIKDAERFVGGAA